MPTKLTKDLLKEKFVEMCRKEMSADSLQEKIDQGIQSYAKLTEMAQETDSPARAALFYTMSNYLDDVLKLHTKYGLGKMMDLKDDTDLYEKVKKDGLLDMSETAEQRVNAFNEVYNACDFENSPEVTEFNEAKEALNEKISEFTSSHGNLQAMIASAPFLNAYDTKKLYVMCSVVEKLSNGKELDENTFSTEERSFISIAADTASRGFDRAVLSEESEYFSNEQSEQIRLRVNKLDGKENDTSVAVKLTENCKRSAAALYSMGTENIVVNSEQLGIDDSDEAKRPADVLLDNKIKRLNQMIKFDTLSEGKYAVFSLSNSSELPKMTASEFIEKAKIDDTSVEQCQWAEKMTDAFLEKLNKNGRNYTVDNLMVDGKFIEGYSDTDKKEKFVAAALEGKKLDLAIIGKDDNGNVTSGRTMPIQLNDCLEKSWSFIEWLKSLFGFDRESRVKAANESVRDESKRQNNQERIRMSFEDLLGNSGNTRKTVKSQSSEMENSLERKSLDESFL